MKNIRGLLALLLVLIMVAQTGILGVSAAAPDIDDIPYNSGERNEIANTLNGTSAGAYYTGNYTYGELSKKSGDELYNSLHTLMAKTTYISNYDNCRDWAYKTDCENGNGLVSLIYTDYDATMEQYNGWNREHVWPKNLGKDSTSGGGADLHHIRPSDAVVNSTRGSKKYGNANNGTKVYGNNPAVGYLGGTTTSAYFEPNDNVKGDVARICLYVYVRWGSDWGATSITKVFESVDVLLEWCALDPVDTWELGRNDVVYAIQGNRNVFIDYPELAWNLFNREAPANMPSPSKGNPDGVTSPTNATEAPTEATTTAPTTPSVDPSVTGSATISFADTANRTSLTSEQQIWQQNGITVTNYKTSQSNPIAGSSNPVRFYAHSNLKVEAPGMLKIEFNCASGYVSPLNTSIANSSAYSVSVNGNIVTVTFNEAVDSFVVNDLTAQVRVNSLTVQCEVVTPDTPGTDTPGTDTPGTNTPGTDTPGTDTPGTDTPGTNTPGTDTPGTDTPGTDTPGTDTPGTDTPGTDTPGTDTPGTNETKKEPTGFMAWLIGIINAILAIFGLRMEV